MIKDDQLREAKDDFRKLQRKHNSLIDEFSQTSKSLKNAVSDINTHKIDLDKTTRDLRYWKEKYESDINEKTIEITGLFDEITKLKLEISNLGNTVCELKAALSAVNDVKAELEGRLNYRETQIRALEGVEIENNKNKEGLWYAKVENDGIIKERDNLIRTVKDLKVNLDHVIKEKTLLEEELRKHKGFVAIFEGDCSELKKQNINANDLISNLRHENSTIKDQNNILKLNTNDLNLSIEKTEKKLRDCEFALTTIRNEKDQADRTVHRLSKELEQFTLVFNEQSNQLKQNQQVLSDYKISLQTANLSCQALLNRLESGKKTPNLENFIAFSYQIRPFNDNPLSDQISFIEDMIKVLASEYEAASIKIDEFSRKTEDQSYKLLNYQEQSGQLESKNESLIRKDREVTLKISRLEEALKTMRNSNEQAEETIRGLKTENKDLRASLNLIKEAKDNLEKEIAKRDQSLVNSKGEISRLSRHIEGMKSNNTALEGRLIGLLNEKKNYLDFIECLGRSGYNSSIQSLVNEILNYFDEISSYAKEQMKLEDEINETTKQLNSIDKLSIGNSNERYGLFTLQEQIKSQLIEITGRIDNRKVIINDLQNKIKEIGIQDKIKFQKISELEMKIKILKEQGIKN